MPALTTAVSQAVPAQKSEALAPANPRPAKRDIPEGLWDQMSVLQETMIFVLTRNWTRS